MSYFNNFIQILKTFGTAFVAFFNDLFGKIDRNFQQLLCQYLSICISAGENRKNS